MDFLSEMDIVRRAEHRQQRNKAIKEWTVAAVLLVMATVFVLYVINLFLVALGMP